MLIYSLIFDRSDSLSSKKILGIDQAKRPYPPPGAIAPDCNIA